MPRAQVSQDHRIKPPFSQAELERYHLRSKALLRPADTGGHLTMRRGQSLEFKDFADYHPGDDIRYVDWRASMRHGLRTEWVTRTFHAEEKMRLLISIDHRASMRLPEQLPKLRQACWLAFAFHSILKQTHDLVQCDTLFGEADTHLEKSSKHTDHYQTLMQSNQPEEKFILGSRQKRLDIASVWIIISDFYFQKKEAIQPLAAQVTKKRAGQTWVMLVDLDSWPFEKQILGQGARKIEGPDLNVPDPRFDLTPDHLNLVEQKIHFHKQHLFKQLNVGSDFTTWFWPVDTASTERDLFRAAFFNDKTLQRLLMKDSL